MKSSSGTVQTRFSVPRDLPGHSDLEQHMTIDRRLTVSQHIQQHPSALPFLTAAGVDTCCGGALSLEEAGPTGAAADCSPAACSCGCANT
jgi:hypothetical protein